MVKTSEECFTVIKMESVKAKHIQEGMTILPQPKQLIYVNDRINELLLMQFVLSCLIPQRLTIKHWVSKLKVLESNLKSRKQNEGCLLPHQVQLKRALSKSTEANLQPTSQKSIQSQPFHPRDIMGLADQIHKVSTGISSTVSANFQTSLQ